MLPAAALLQITWLATTSKSMTVLILRCTRSMHQLLVHELFDAVGTEFATHAGSLRATEWQLGAAALRCVDPHHAGVEAVGHVERQLLVGTVDTRAEAVGRVVRQGHGFVGASDTVHHGNWSKEFLTERAHLGYYVSEHTRFEERTRSAHPTSAGAHGRAFADGVFNLLLQVPRGLLGRQWAVRGVRVSRVAGRAGRHRGGELFDELVVDGVGNNEALGCVTGLTAILHTRPDRLTNYFCPIVRVEDNEP